MRSVVGYLEGNWRTAAEEGAAAAEILRSNCTGVNWELGTANIFSFIGRCALGQFNANRKLLPALIKEARDRGDLYTTSTVRLLGCSYILDTSAGDPEKAMRELEEDVASWQRPDYDLQKSNALMGRIDVHLYCGRAEQAWNEVLREWPILVRSGLLRLPTPRVFQHFARGRAGSRRCGTAMPAIQPPGQPSPEESKIAVQSKQSRQGT